MPIQRFCPSVYCFALTLAVFVSKAAFTQRAPTPAFPCHGQDHGPTSRSLTGTGEWIAGSGREHGTVLEAIASDGLTSEIWTFSTPSHARVHRATDLASFARVFSHTDEEGNKPEINRKNCPQAVSWFDPSFVLISAHAGPSSITDLTTEAKSSRGLMKLSYAVSILPPMGLSKASLDALQAIRPEPRSLFPTARAARPSWL